MRVTTIIPIPGTEHHVRIEMAGHRKTSHVSWDARSLDIGDVDKYQLLSSRLEETDLHRKVRSWWTRHHESFDKKSEAVYGGTSGHARFVTHESARELVALLKEHISDVVADGLPLPEGWPFC